MIRIVLAEDEHLTRDAVARLLDMEADLEIVGQASNGEEAISVIEALRPDVAVLDIEMPGPDGADVVTRFPVDRAGTRCVILTRHARPGVLRRALAAGAMGFVTKSTPAATLAEVIRAVHAGSRYVDPELAALALSTADCPLSDRELAVLRHVELGATTDAISAAVHLSPGTVRNYLSSVMDKLGVHSRAEAAAQARDHGWI